MLVAFIPVVLWVDALSPSENMGSLFSQYPWCVEVTFLRSSSIIFTYCSTMPVYRWRGVVCVLITLRHCNTSVQSSGPGHCEALLDPEATEFDHQSIHHCWWLFVRDGPNLQSLTEVVLWLFGKDFCNVYGDPLKHCPDVILVHGPQVLVWWPWITVHMSHCWHKL